MRFLLPSWPRKPCDLIAPTFLASPDITPPHPACFSCTAPYCSCLYPTLARAAAPPGRPFSPSPGKRILTVTSSGTPAWIAQEGRSFLVCALQNCVFSCSGLTTWCCLSCFWCLAVQLDRGAPGRQGPGQTQALSVFPSRHSLRQAPKCLGGKGKKEGKGHLHLHVSNTCYVRLWSSYTVVRSSEPPVGQRDSLQKQEALESSQGPGLYH